MTTLTVDQLLPRVRRWVIERAAKGRPNFGLSYLAEVITPEKDHKHIRGKHSRDIRPTIPPIYRGRVQQCLSILAREGVAYGRNQPERCVARYNPSPDKIFTARLTQAEAIQRLKKMK